MDDRDNSLKFSKLIAFLDRIENIKANFILPQPLDIHYSVRTYLIHPRGLGRGTPEQVMTQKAEGGVLSKL